MRILIDLQGAQGDSRVRGIGRYALAFTLAVARNRGIHDVHIALSDLFPETIESIRGTFDRVLPQKNIHVWCAEPGLAMIDASSGLRRCYAEIQREAFLASLHPDILIITSLFEGFGDDCVTSVNRHTTLRTAAIFYDLIPLIYEKSYLTDRVYASWYHEKLAQLKQADLLLAISESSRVDGIHRLGIDPEWIVNVGAGTDRHFRPRLVSESQLVMLKGRYRLNPNFIMYTGAFDWRKNIEALIRAYGALPKLLRRKHQLALIGDLHPRTQSTLEELARTVGLEEQELVVTGYVSDDDLLTLYNACLAFAFPSLHEGFGLPVLEAMQCGKAVLAANTSSLPEVVGRPEALFDPRDDAAIVAALKRVIEDDGFREELERHGPKQAAKFSWDNTAHRAIAAMENAVERPGETKGRQRLPGRKRLAYVSPLPPVRSGISDYSARLLPALSAFYEIDVIVEQPQVFGDWIVSNCRQRDVEWFRVHCHEYHRVLYQFGSAPLHEHMVDLIERIPGTVVLHEFFLSENCSRNQLFLRHLKESHGYGTVVEFLSALSANSITQIFPVNLSVIQNAHGIIVHSEKACQVASQWYGDGVLEKFQVIPPAYAVSRVTEAQREEARDQIGIPKNSLLLCNFDYLSPASLNDRLILSFLSSNLAAEADVYLFIIGQPVSHEYELELRKIVSGSGLEGRIRITSSANRDTLEAYLKAADIGIQLSGESSDMVIHWMSYGVPTVISNIEAIANIYRDGVWILDCPFEEEKLKEALEKLAQDPTLRERIGMKAQDLIRHRHSPERCAALYADAIETFYAKDANGVGGVVRKLSEIKFTESDARILASTLGLNFPPRPRLRQLLVDVSELTNRDAKTGVQRVVRAILFHWLLNPPRGWLVEPVYASFDRQGYRYARRFACAFLGIDASWIEDEPVDAWQGDIFIGLDLQSHAAPAQREVLDRWYRLGVDVRFVVYDLLPVLRPEFFDDGWLKIHSGWLAFISRFNGAICISRAVARELRDWCNAYAEPRSIPFIIDWFHLGADIRRSVPSFGGTDYDERALTDVRKAPAFLMVGTLEPRKGHRQALDAFDILWKNGVRANLVIIGKEGWKIQDFVERVKRHPELGARLFWLDNVTDEYLEKIYAASTCLIAASEGEGFGLPLIEAAQHGLPIIARDLPVFREVAEEHVFYFKGLEPKDLATAVAEWLRLYEARSHVQSSRMHWLTWTQSAEMLLARLGIGTPTRDTNRAISH